MWHAPNRGQRGVILAKVSRPNSPSIRVERNKLTGAEPGIHPLAIGHRARCREVSLIVDVRQLADCIDAVLSELADATATGSPMRAD
jgi:hypothetical protein